MIVIPVVERHRSTCSRRIALVSLVAIVNSLRAVSDDCGTYGLGAVDAVVLALTKQLESVRLEEIIGIPEQQILADCMLHACIAHSARALVHLRNHPYTMVLADRAIQKGRR